MTDIVPKVRQHAYEMVSNDSESPWVAYTTVAFDLAFNLQGHIEGLRTGHQESYRIYVSTRTKMVSNDGKPPWAAYTANLLPDIFQSQIQGQMTGYQISSRN